jgi:hypothetical protein
MPLALRDLQAAFAAHLAGTDHGGLAAEVVGDSIPAAARLRVYRHHVVDSLAAALAATFPTVQALVGADFFRGLAGDFVARSLPVQPVLSEYGEGFASFIAGHEAARDLPYLADVARLDWALNAAFQAPVAGRLRAGDLSVLPADRLPSLRLCLAPGAALVSSAYPLDRIWSASQPNAPDGTVDLDGGGSCLLVLRGADDSAFVRLSRGESAFVESLGAGKPLEDASLAASQADRGFDLSASFARLLGLGTFAALQ